MSDKRARSVKKLAACWREYQKDDSKFPYVVLRVADHDTYDTWYYLVVGLDDSFKGGQYLFEAKPIMEPRSNNDTRIYPDVAPNIKPLTPTGLFEVGKAFCISNGQYHREQTTQLNQGAFALTNNMVGFAKNIVSPFLGMRELGGGINLIYRNHSDDDRQKFARKSVAYNWEHYPEIMALFADAPELANPKDEKQKDDVEIDTENLRKELQEVKISDTKNDKLSKLKAAAAKKKAMRGM